MRMGECPTPDRHVAQQTQSVGTRTIGCPAIDSEPHEPPQTQSETGAVKFPQTMPMRMHTCIHHHVHSWS